jgi:hypothetical protein
MSSLAQNYEWIIENYGCFITKLLVEYHKIVSGLIIPGLSQNNEWNLECHKL